MLRDLIAPCGMNCGICLAYLRDKNRCEGCNSDNQYKPASCISCILKNCEVIANNKSKLCYECEKYPCKRLKQLDKRYRLKYNMSMLDNLKFIKERGMDEFLINEKIRWTCKECGGVICVHRGCLKCGKK